jgi:valyl-tRNA synthetase
MELDARYSPHEIEGKWYKYWLENKYFKSVPDEREPFTILIPPPNVTGVLHMGHMLNITIQDVLIRHARINGKNACWVPGTDHASIATEAKVVGLLRDKGLNKYDIGRDAFLEYAFEWKEKYGGIILGQLQKLGASCDWDRTRFTMEPSLSNAVTKVFVDLHKKGKLYRGLRMTNWDPEAKTVLSGEEVIYKEEQAQLFHIFYPLVGDPEQGITIATQRPETIMADVAIAVHPEDPRYQSWVGKQVLIPLINKPIPIIADTYVDIEFGTGALKITPAHDQNDNEVGQRHNLPVVDILDESGKLNEDAQILVGEDRFEARKKIKTLLKDAGNLVKIEDYRTNIGRSERTNAVVEPRLTKQWFLDMKSFAATALSAVKSGEVRFFPENMWNMYTSWLNEENIRDWCISRQLWWGQRIPAWYYTDILGNDHTFVAETAEEALEIAKVALQLQGLQLSDLNQDQDVVDTWFSSWLWPISVFDGFENQEELKYYYPTNVLVTGWDIMFFWVARMIMAGYEWSYGLLGPELSASKGKQPFHDVYFTGMVRDNKRRKMSKSLGNSPDALSLMETYGADGVRFGILSSAAAGNDIIFDAPFDPATGQIRNESKLCEQGRNFCNKIWNAFRLIQGWNEDASLIQTDSDLAAQSWMDNRIREIAVQLENLYKQYRLSEAIMELYKLIWDDYCSWYLEMIKPAYGSPIHPKTKAIALRNLETLLQYLHPFMPFITEEIWQQIKHRETHDALCVYPYPQPEPADPKLSKDMQIVLDIISQVRNLRSSRGLSPKEPLQLSINTSHPDLYTNYGSLITKLAFLESLELSAEKPERSVTFLVHTEECHVVLKTTINAEDEREKLTEELAYLEGFLDSVNKKLSNERFVQNAKPEIVATEQKKKADAELKIKAIKENLSNL